MGEAISAVSGPTEDLVVRWLLEPQQPAVRALALVDLLGKPAADPEVTRSRSRIGKVGWAAEQLRRQGPEGFWEKKAPKTMSEWVDFLYNPIFQATNWRALVLADLGMDRTDRRIRKLAELIFQYKLRLSSPFNFFHEEVCIAGNTARMMTRFGYGEDRRVRWLFDWLIEDQRADGGWNCSQGTPGTLDAWEALAAFAVVPKQQRSPKMQEAIRRGAEFYLERGLLREGGKYPPWSRLHYPNHYYYDVLVGLDVITQLGYAADRRLLPAAALLRSKQSSDGTWNLDQAHPDTAVGKKRPRAEKGVTPLVIETPGKPSKWITLKALTVLKRVDDAG